MSNELCKCGKVGNISCPNDERCGAVDKQLSTEERIKADAAARYPATDEGVLMAAGYIAGATAENERAQVLVDALDQFISFHESGLLPAKHVYEKAIAARKQWKEGKDEPVKADNICGICKVRPKGEGITICDECYQSFDGDRRGFWNSEDIH